MRPVYFLATFLAILPAWTMSFGKATVDPIGVKTIHYQDLTRNRPILIEFWYPTDEKRASQIEEDVWVYSTKEARDASFAAEIGSRPLIIMSHGHRGSAREGTWLVDSLVRNGFVVAAVEHHGNTWNQYDPVASFCFWDRAKDISFALTQLLQDPSVNSIIDPNRIGFIGYSMGGMTGLALAGAEAKIDLRELAGRLQTEVQNAPQDLLTHIDFSEAEKNYREPRIHSMLLICPAAFVYLPENLQQIHLPLGIIASLEDEVLPYLEHAHKVIQNVAPKKIKLMRNQTSHYAFLNKMTEKGYALLQKAVSKKNAYKNRTPVHKEAANFTLKFFQETLQEQAP